ncbi:unnamed protein product [Linum tenue]|uniref:Uncharacterized protein n=1 Tax=Linum tenue TaxID=586396 RepID=A0AAV0LCK9_9ROSI|nr:unnamed protein product [Linum tenue]
MDKLVNFLHFFRLPLLLLLLLALICSMSHHGHVAASKSTVEYLPGFQGRLPFYLETGYIGVGEAAGLFYYFVKSEGNPEADPLLLWLTGGPGCSGLTGLALEIGPIKFNESLPTLILNPFSWTKFSSIIFLDLPAGTGFSYTTNPSLADHPSDHVQVSQAAEFIRKGIPTQALLFHPLSNDFPLGYILGNPGTSGEFDKNARIPSAHGMALISDELYESLHKSCKGEYHIVDPTNLECKNNLEAFYECLSGINMFNPLDPQCILHQMPVEIAALRRRRRRRLLQDESRLLSTIDPPELDCKYDINLLCKHWANDELVQKALHIRKPGFELSIAPSWRIGDHGTLEAKLQGRFAYPSD